jgi:sortase A
MTHRKHWLAAAALLLAFAGTWQVAAAGWIHAKALLAQHLIASAWDRGQASGLPTRPWPGADMKPVARLTVPARGIQLYVLDNATPRALAFGPAHVGGTATPAADGNSVIVAHRDTHFAFLRHLSPGDAIEVEGARGHTRYRVREVSVVHQSETRVLEDDGDARLTLITCFPFFAANAGTELRYVVVAERVA